MSRAVTCNPETTGNLTTLGRGDIKLDGLHHITMITGDAQRNVDFYAELLGLLASADYDGLRFEVVVAASGNPPLAAAHPEVPAEHALIGPQGARAYGREAGAPAPLLTEALGFDALGEGGYRLAGDHRRFEWAYDDAPAEAGRQGAGTVHHIRLGLPRRGATAAAAPPAPGRRDGHRGPRPRLLSLDLLPRAARDPLRDRDALSGFAVDEDPDHLGEALTLPRMHEHLRPQLERTLRPLVNPRARRPVVQA